MERQSGYIMARMKHEIVLAPEAAQDLKRLKAHDRAEVKDALGRHLRYEPSKVSKSRIKRLRGMNHPRYRLRVGEIRVFYDIKGNRVEILAIVPKTEAVSWLKEIGG
jgi:mRNA-degrading endonuclease RelE of RelBE toxin-antitoxin system